MKRSIILLGTLFLVLTMNAQSVIHPAFEDWTFSNPDDVVKETFKGKESMIIKGAAYLKDVVFTNGIIEFDVALPEYRGFSGVIFRVQDEHNYEEFYMRPHQSGNPDANQYTPVFNGQSGWQLYYGEGHGAPVKYEPNEWMHVKLVVKGKQGEVYFWNEEKPSLVIHELKRDELSGYLGWSGGFRFADFSYQIIDNPVLLGEFKTINKPEKEIIQKWKVSEPFSDSELGLTLDDTKLSTLKWQETWVESKGLVNIAKYTNLTKELNTVYVRVTIDSKMAQMKKLSFGYSDKASVYCNGTIMYSGNRTFRLEDYRYLGTIGYFDEVYLPLKKGKNELVIAISESGGGWGVQAKFEYLDGITAY